MTGLSTQTIRLVRLTHMSVSGISKWIEWQHFQQVNRNLMLMLTPAWVVDSFGNTKGNEPKIGWRQTSYFEM